MSRSVNAKRLANGVYEYQGYKLANCGHYMSDYKVWWVAVNIKTGYISFFANSKKELMQIIDKDELEGEESRNEETKYNAGF